MTGAGPMAEPPSPRPPHPMQTGGVHVTLRALLSKFRVCLFQPG